MGPRSLAVAWLGLVVMKEARMDTPKHKARTQMMHEEPEIPVP
jgi:hypothetical protein